MAKKALFSFDDLNKEISKISELGNIMSDSKFSEIDEWISTGNYLLNALISGSLFKGIPNNRGIALQGETSTGKTFLTLNLVKCAIEQGYYIVYFDSENSVDKDLMVKFNIDTNLVRHEPVTTVQEFRTLATNILDLLIEKKRKGVEIPKIMFVMDSLGNLATQKEIDDASSGSEKADMTRAKVIKSIFRIITTKLGEIHAPLVITNHTYQSQGFISQTVGAGGEGLKYAASIILNLSKAQLKEGDSKTGIIVTAKSVKNRFAKPLQEIKFQISFSKGMNPYIGLHNYVSWETCGIGVGKILNQKDFLKKYDSEDGEEFELNGEKLYFVKDEGKEFAIKHLGRTVKNHEFFTPAVFTNEILKQLDDKVIKEIFEFGDSYEDDIDNILDDSDDSEL